MSRDGEAQFVLYNMDVIKALKRIKNNTVDCVMTSPPYWSGVCGIMAQQTGREEIVIVNILKKSVYLPERIL